MSRRRRKLPPEPIHAVIESLTHDGKGVAHVDGKAVFIDGALPGEEVNYVLTRRQRRFDNGRAVEILRPSPERVEAKCRHYGVCGGCSLQHMEGNAQIRAKEKVLLGDFQHLAGIMPESLLSALTGPAWGYRRKARLGVKYVTKKGKVLVGFREKSSPYLAELEQCEVLHPDVGLRLEQLANMIAGMEAYQRIAQIEISVGDTATALVFRNLDPLSKSDLEALRRYGEQTGLHIWLQSAGPDSLTPLYPEQSELFYRLDAYDLEYAFLPNDFTQVNRDINQAMVERALTLLELEPQHRVLDLFCGLGNFTLPIAKQVSQVVGVEGETGLVERARDNAQRNGITNAEFYVADLNEDPSHIQALSGHWSQGPYDRILLDPARSGALEMMPHLPELGAKRIVYVSCNPATLARDAGELVNKHGYRLVQAGVMDMFPHTAHVESIALFVKD